MMLRNYLKLAWRNLLKDRQFSLLNLLGLSVGLACALLIGLWIADEYGMEKYNPNDDRLYQVMTNNKTSNGLETRLLYAWHPRKVAQGRVARSRGRLRGIAGILVQ